ncbi:MAG: hypothetical protein Q4P66_05265 [Actinomycetaceae bacterium]|nr:hypothetical protein [Actinomycetaceae bacterium]
MQQKQKTMRAAVASYFEDPLRRLQVFEAKDDVVVGVSPARIVVVEAGKAVLNEPWSRCKAVVWDSETDTLELSYIEYGRHDSVIKCTNAPSEIFLHTMREALESTHVLHVEHRSESGVMIRMGIIRQSDSSLRYWETIAGTLTRQEAEEVERLRQRVKDSVGLDY